MAEELRCEGLTLSWQGEPVVRDVTLDVAPGTLACLVGRSGSGKTTLFHAVAGLTSPDSGRVLLGGRDVTGRPGSVAYMLQKDLLLPQRTILDNCALPLLLRGVPKAEARQRAAGHFERFGIAGTERQYPCQLSGGMRQRAALLRTYLMDSPAVLMDEPFSALDALTRADMRHWFLDMLTRLDLTAMLITHDVEEAVAMADKIYVLAGNPAAGVPSTIAGAVEVDAPRDARDGFLLSDAALDVKRQVLALLG